MIFDRRYLQSRTPTWVYHEYVEISHESKEFLYIFQKLFFFETSHKKAQL